MLSITSPQNPTIKLIRSLSDKKNRGDAGLFVAEGIGMLNRARQLGWEPVHLLATEPIPAWGSATASLVSEKIMESLSGQNNPHTILATFKQRYHSDLSPHGVWVALEDMRDPGNLGTIIRTCDAIGATGVVLLGHSCDPYSRDCVRASTGSIFAVPLVTMDTETFIAQTRSWPGEIVGTHLKAKAGFRRTYRSPTLLVMGSEATGLTADLAAACGTLVHIPMKGGAESLNVATATALMLYEIARL